MEDINQRILTLMEEFDQSPSIFADKIGVIRSSISHIISGRNKPGLDLLQKILSHYHDISAEWLLLGEGRMHKNNALSKEILDNQPNKNEFTNVNEAKVTSEDKEVRAMNMTSNQKNTLQAERVTIYYADGTYRDFYPR